MLDSKHMNSYQSLTVTINLFFNLTVYINVSVPACF